MFSDTAELELSHGLLLRSVIHCWASARVVNGMDTGSMEGRVAGWLAGWMDGRRAMAWRRAVSVKCTLINTATSGVAFPDQLAALRIVSRVYDNVHSEMEPGA